MKNYRRAKKGEIKCRDCKHVRPPNFPGGWHRCGYIRAQPGPRYAIGQTRTCDYAQAKEPAGEAENT